MLPVQLQHRLQRVGEVQDIDAAARSHPGRLAPVGLGQVPDPPAILGVAQVLVGNPGGSEAVVAAGVVQDVDIRHCFVSMTFRCCLTGKGRSSLDMGLRVRAAGISVQANYEAASCSY